MPISAAEPARDARSTFSVLGFFMTPWVDKTVAILACLPFLVSLYLRIRASSFDLPRIVVAIHLCVLVGTMISRRVPSRITPNPLFWLLAFVATYWGLPAATFAPRGRALLANLGTNSIAILSLVILLWARLGVGRNIGFVPAQRQIVTHGACCYMRHPVYTSLFLSPL
jgi:protein-S-isoprenylcysteine O-methyltransferase Ste14